jgi:hypothetical protein
VTRALSCCHDDGADGSNFNIAADCGNGHPTAGRSRGLKLIVQKPQIALVDYDETS